MKNKTPSSFIFVALILAIFLTQNSLADEVSASLKRPPDFGVVKAKLVEALGALDSSELEVIVNSATSYQDLIVQINAALVDYQKIASKTSVKPVSAYGACYDSQGYGDGKISVVKLDRKGNPIGNAQEVQLTGGHCGTTGMNPIGDVLLDPSVNLKGPGIYRVIFNFTTNTGRQDGWKSQSVLYQDDSIGNFQGTVERKYYEHNSDPQVSIPKPDMIIWVRR